MNRLKWLLQGIPFLVCPPWWCPRNTVAVLLSMQATELSIPESLPHMLSPCAHGTCLLGFLPDAPPTAAVAAAAAAAAAAALPRAALTRPAACELPPFCPGTGSAIAMGAETETRTEIGIGIGTGTPAQPPRPRPKTGTAKGSARRSASVTGQARSTTTSHHRAMSALSGNAAGAENASARSGEVGNAARVGVQSQRLLLLGRKGAARSVREVGRVRTARRVAASAAGRAPRRHPRPSQQSRARRKRAESDSQCLPIGFCCWCRRTCMNSIARGEEHSCKPFVWQNSRLAHCYGLFGGCPWRS